MKFRMIPALAITAALIFGAASPALAGVDKAKKHKPAKKKVQPGIGYTHTVLNQQKQYEAVKLVAVTDPAQGADQFSTPDAGMRFVGVELSITNKSKGADTSDANNNASVIGSNRQVYKADFNTIAGCTNFGSGQYTLPKGANEVGCVTFQIPTGITVSKVEWNPDSGFSTNDVTWTLIPPA